MDEPCEERVALNVGGSYFETKKSTLLRTGSSYFEQRLEQYNHGDLMFIDRDPFHFSIILNYLRNLQISLPIELSKSLLENLYCDAQYFDLQDFQNVITRSLTKLEKHTEFDSANGKGSFSTKKKT